MENAVVSPSNLFWNKLGKWQLLAVSMTLATFFITLHFIGDKEKAALAAGFTALAITLAAALASALAITLAAAFTALAATLAATFAAFTALATTLAATLATLAAFTATDELGKYGIRKKVIWFSLAAEFVCIALPILLTH